MAPFQFTGLSRRNRSALFALFAMSYSLIVLDLSAPVLHAQQHGCRPLIYFRATLAVQNLGLALLFYRELRNRVLPHRRSGRLVAILLILGLWIVLFWRLLAIQRPS